ncbi:MAG: tyrosine-type recombinase/integrase [Gemmatimonadetes bacterium]|nr:tyrosine-type recombinase/integrase [Gemmatimonadota bacterium]
MRLTVSTVKQARYRGGQDIRFDDEVRGFGLRINPRGTKSYVLKYRTRAGRSRLLTIGRANVLPLAEARQRARRALTAVLDGKDPQAERQRERASITVAEFCELYLKRHSRPRKKTWKEDERRLNKWVVPVAGKVALGDLSTADLSTLHARIAEEGPVEANRVLELVRAMLNRAREWGHLPEAGPNPAGRVERFPEHSRERFLTRDELPRVIVAINEERNVYVRAVLLFLLLTGLRKGEALSIRWEDVDFDNRLVRLPVTKTGRGRTVPLTPAAVRLLDSLPREAGNPWAFPGHRAGSHLSSLAKPWSRIRARAGVPDVTLHDLRRSVGSHLAMAGVGLPIVGSILGHASPDATAIYARLQPDAGREALDRYTAMLTQLTGEDAWDTGAA